MTALVKTRKFDVVERSRVDRLLDEMDLTEAGFMDPARAVQAGRMIGADYFLMGEISVWTHSTHVREIPHTKRFMRQSELRLIVDMRIVDTRTSKIVAAEKGDTALGWKQMFRQRPAAAEPLDPVQLDQVQRDLVDQLVRKVIDAVYPIKVIAVDPTGVAVNRGRAPS